MTLKSLFLKMMTIFSTPSVNTFKARTSLEHDDEHNIHQYLL